MANKKYSKLAHDYELTFTPKTEVEICEAAQNFPKIELIFTEINLIENLNIGEFIGINKYKLG